MSDGGGGPKNRKSALDALVQDAKRDLAPRIEGAKWDALEEQLFARMSRESRESRESEGESGSLDARARLAREVSAARGPSSSSGSRSRVRMMQVGAAILAVAAAVAVVVKRDPATGFDPTTVATRDGVTELNAGSLRSTEGAGEIRVGGHPVAAGHVLRAGEVIEATGDARAVLERPRKVTWLLERSPTDQTPARTIQGPARATVKTAGESLVLGLEDGAIEAQVTPVPSGEAFAVDVAAGTKLVRVAVHGTHLRVARFGNRVTIDLTEGVVSIGVPPRTGSTYGTLVTAPSHVEFDAADLDATLRVDHAPGSVRLAVALSHDSLGAAANDAPASRAQEPGEQRPSAPPARIAEGAIAPPATVPRPSPVVRAADGAVVVAPVDPIAKVDPAKPVLPPREAIARAVRDCAAARNRPENVRVTVTSSLKLKIAKGGDVETAQFDPPLLPEIQTCAATAIYKAKLEDAAGGTMVTIPIDFSY